MDSTIQRWADDGGLTVTPVRAPNWTREDWLRQATIALRPLFKQAGYEVPGNVRVSVGFPSGRGRLDRVIGQCWSRVCSTDNHWEIFLTPTMDEQTKVLATLVHELGHTILPDAGHRKPFADLCRAMYLKGPWTATSPAEGFDTEIEARVMAFVRWPFPHARMSIRGEILSPVPRDPGTPGEPEEPPGRIGKAGTRLLKCTCPECGYTVRVTRKWLDLAPPACVNPAHESEAPRLMVEV